MARPTRDRQRKPPPEVSKSFETGVRSAGLIMPLDYLLAVVRDETAAVSRRDRLAIVAARYCHPKAGSVGKKVRQSEAAEKAGAGTAWADDLEYSDGRPLPQ